MATQRGGSPVLHPHLWRCDRHALAVGGELHCLVRPLLQVGDVVAQTLLRHARQTHGTPGCLALDPARPVVQRAAVVKLHGQAARRTRGATLGPTLELVEGVAKRSEEPTSELQSLMRISYAVFFLNK